MEFQPCKIDLGGYSPETRSKFHIQIQKIWIDRFCPRSEVMKSKDRFIIMDGISLKVTDCLKEYTSRNLPRVSVFDFLTRYDPDRNKIPSHHVSGPAVDIPRRPFVTGSGIRPPKPNFIMHCGGGGGGGVNLTPNERRLMLNGEFTPEHLPKIEPCKMDLRGYNDTTESRIIDICFKNNIFWSGDNGPRYHKDIIGFLYIDSEILLEAPGDSEAYLADDLPAINPNDFIERYEKTTGDFKQYIHKCIEENGIIKGPTPPHPVGGGGGGGIGSDDYAQLEARALSVGFTPPKDFGVVVHGGGGGGGVVSHDAKIAPGTYKVGHRHTAAIKPPKYLQIPVMAPGGFDYFTLETNGRPIRKETTLKMLRDDIREPSERELAYACKMAGVNAPEPEKPAPVLNLIENKLPIKL